MKMSAEAFRELVGADMPRTLPEQCEWAGLPKPVAEYRFAPPRRFRFDFCWVEQKIAVEVDGGLWIYGRHNRASGAIKDMEKLNLAVSLGYRVLRFTPDQVRNGTALNELRPLLEKP
jgi:very-short-patch-repair endonuclease